MGDGGPPAEVIRHPVDGGDEHLMKRGQFLRGMAALVVTPVAALKIVERLLYPTLYGDGLHDETAALQAFFDGDPVWVDGELVTESDRILRNGSYFTTEPVHLRARNLRGIEGARFGWSGPYSFHSHTGSSGPGVCNSVFVQGVTA